MAKELTEIQVIRALRRLERGWPANLFLTSGTGGVHLMRLGKAGERLMLGNSLRQDEEAVAGHFEIKADGGDPW